MSEHTKGPWLIGDNLRDAPVIRNEQNEAICTLAGYGEQVEPNARLIAAAPELLEACRMAQRWFDDMGPPLGESDSTHRERMLRAALQDAIAKAK